MHMADDKLWGCGVRGFSDSGWWGCKMVQLLGKLFYIFSPSETSPSCEPDTCPLAGNAQNEGAHPPRDSFRVYGSLASNGQRLKATQIPINKGAIIFVQVWYATNWCSHPMKCHSTIKRQGVLIHKTAWISRTLYWTKEARHQRVNTV